MSSEARLAQKAAQVARAVERADGVEAAVEDAVAVFQRGEQAAERLRRRPGLRGQVAGLGFLQALPHAAEVGRVLADEELEREVEGI